MATNSFSIDDLAREHVLSLLPPKSHPLARAEKAAEIAGWPREAFLLAGSAAVEYEQIDCTAEEFADACVREASGLAARVAAE